MRRFLEDSNSNRSHSRHRDEGDKGKEKGIEKEKDQEKEKENFKSNERLKEPARRGDERARNGVGKKRGRAKDRLLGSLEDLLNYKDDHGRTPLHYAAIAQQCDSLRMLIEHGADVLVIDDDGQTAMHTVT